MEPRALIVPLVGFDSQGYRLGYGGGYYDRTLAAAIKRPFCIGLGYATAQVRSICPQPHDIPMNVIATDRMFLQLGADSEARPAAPGIRGTPPARRS